MVRTVSPSFPNSSDIFRYVLHPPKMWIIPSSLALVKGSCSFFALAKSTCNFPKQNLTLAVTITFPLFCIFHTLLPFPQFRCNLPLPVAHNYLLEFEVILPYKLPTLITIVIR